MGVPSSSTVSIASPTIVSGLQAGLAADGDHDESVFNDTVVDADR